MALVEQQLRSGLGIRLMSRDEQLAETKRRQSERAGAEVDEYYRDLAQAQRDMLAETSARERGGA